MFRVMPGKIRKGNKQNIMLLSVINFHLRCFSPDPGTTWGTEEKQAAVWSVGSVGLEPAVLNSADWSQTTQHFTLNQLSTSCSLDSNYICQGISVSSGLSWHSGRSSICLVFPDCAVAMILLSQDHDLSMG